MQLRRLSAVYESILERAPLVHPWRMRMHTSWRAFEILRFFFDAHLRVAKPTVASQWSAALVSVFTYREKREERKVIEAFFYTTSTVEEKLRYSIKQCVFFYTNSTFQGEFRCTMKQSDFSQYIYRHC